MRQRITITLDTDVVYELRKIQANMIKERSCNVPFSEVINTILAKSLKKAR